MRAAARQPSSLLSIPTTLRRAAPTAALRPPPPPRRVCPNPECGPGVFMASHFDRQYCGKCGLTYMFSEDQKGPAPTGGAKKAEAQAAAPAKGKGKK